MAFDYTIYHSNNPTDYNTGWFLKTVPPILGEGGLGDAFDIVDGQTIVVPGHYY